MADSSPLISATAPYSFDILCVIKDTVDPVNDEKLAEFVVGSHAVSGWCCGCGCAPAMLQWYMHQPN